MTLITDLDGCKRTLITCASVMYDGYKPDQIAVLDTETTGLRVDDEVLSLAIIDGRGKVLFSDRFGTQAKSAWPEAQRVNGIAPKDVAGLKTLAARAGEVSKALSNAYVIVGYNHVAYDMPYLFRAGVKVPAFAAYADVMLDFNGLLDTVDPSRHVRRTLANCARFCSIEQQAAHTSLDDARVTLSCMWRIGSWNAGRALEERRWLGNRMSLTSFAARPTR